jgi:hypothetical protein
MGKVSSGGLTGIYLKADLLMENVMARDRLLRNAVAVQLSVRGSMGIRRDDLRLLRLMAQNI